MKKILIVLCCTVLIIQTGFGQSPTIFPSPGTITWCPGETFFYEVRTTGAQQTGCTYTWSVTNGTITGGQNTFKVSVIWDNTASNGTLKITLTNCTEATNTSKTENYVIRSVAGQTPQNFRFFVGPFPLCNTSQVALSVDRMFVPNTGGATGVTLREVDGYEWEKPTGWSGSSSTEQIFLTPSNGCVEGSVRVRGYIDCGIRRYSNWSQPIGMLFKPG